MPLGCEPLASSNLALSASPGRGAGAHVGPGGVMNVFDAVGENGFTRLVDHFYTGVAADPVLQPLYPAGDMDGARRRLTLFLIQYWGGPDTYSRERGHPRLRMRHAPFAIGMAEREAWLALMREAVASLVLSPEVESALMGYFEPASMAMINQLT